MASRKYSLGNALAAIILSAGLVRQMIEKASSLCLLAGVLSALSIYTQGVAQTSPELDQVHLGPVITSGVDAWESRQVNVISGRIRQLNAESLVLDTADGRSMTIASERVERVAVHWSKPQARAAMDLLMRREYRQAIPALENALKEGVPRWQSRFLVEGIVQCAWGLERPRVAGIVWLQYLAKSAPPLVLYADMPLCWTVREVDPQLQQSARQWLESDEEAERLVGASWLLFSQQSLRAEQELRRLRNSQNQPLAQLAAAQLWRTIPPSETMSRLPEWMRYLDSLRPPLQLGPTEFLADRLMRIGETDLAFGQWMRIATQSGHRYHRALPAMRQAAELLEREGRSEAARRLNEWIERLGKS